MSISHFETGTPVQFTSDRLGLLENIGDNHFIEAVARRGDDGVYQQPHPLLDNWHIISVERDGKTFYCPCYESQFFVAT